MKNLDAAAKSLSIADYTYDLPEHRIAAYPLKERDRSKLLVYNDGHIEDAAFGRLHEYIESDALMLFNDTRVVQARMEFFKSSGARIEIFCLNPVAPHTDLQLALAQTAACSWTALVGNAKKWKSGALEIRNPKKDFCLKVHNQGKLGDAYVIHFEWDPPGMSFGEVLEEVGRTPLPPYITRAAEEGDKSSYQCVFARNKGSVAAPTAGLHFTPAMMEKLHRNGITTGFLTLHVGAGTFKPVSSTTISGHIMHEEQFVIDTGLLESIIQHLSKKEHSRQMQGAGNSREASSSKKTGFSIASTSNTLNGQYVDSHEQRLQLPIVATGTTTMRTLESLYWIGAMIKRGHDPAGELLSLAQWVPYEWEGTLPSSKEALEALLRWARSQGLRYLKGHTALIIVPGYEFKLTDMLVTNFHLPRSTLLMLVAAFAGDGWKTLYEHALAGDYRFLSYGDACLLFKKCI